MSQSRYPRHERDYAELEMRYAKFLKIAALPEDQWDAAIRAFLDEVDRENGQREASTGPIVSDGSEKLLEQQTQQPFPKRSRHELKQLVLTFMRLLIDEPSHKPN